MSVRINQIHLLKESMTFEKVDMEHFRVRYNNVNFDAVFDISTSPYELLLGAINHQWASVVSIRPGYIASMPDEDFYALRTLFELKQGKGEFNSSIFLTHIADHAPTRCTLEQVPLPLMRRLRPVQPDHDGIIRDVFIGWNDHLADGRIARNFDKTERYFGKTKADFCRKRNISTMWTYQGSGRDKESTDYLPPGFPQK